ncbi:MAG: hypothetical protein LH603_11415 [Pseudonocardia sp.]|nr:hypothetical protein [Pseudonocardia sp.]
MTDPGCGGHGGLSVELRDLAVVALDRLEPVLDRLRAEPDAAGAGPDGDGPSADGPSADGRGTARICASCPVCAVLAALRGERPEMAVRLAEQAAGLVTVLRAALDEERPPRPSGPADPPPEHATDRTPGGRTVHRIHIDRVPVAR